MRRINETTLFIMLLIVCLFLASCGQTTSLPIGDYVFEDVVYVGGLSSATMDALRETKSGTGYVLTGNSLRIVSNIDTIEFENISVFREELTDEYISAHYNEQDEQLMDFFDGYSDRWQFNLFDKDGQQIHYCLYQMDGDLFLSKFVNDETLILSIDKMAVEKSAS